MKYPLFLSSDNTIGFTAPSFGCTYEPYRSCFEAAISNFEQLGFKTLCGLNCYMDDGIGISTNPSDCASELLSMYSSDETQALISCGGGELMCETIGELDFEKINQSKPKWFLGYSDNTNFGFLLVTLCDTASIYGINAPAFGMSPWHLSVQDTLDVLTGKKLNVSSYEKWEINSLKSAENPFASYNCTENNSPIAYDFSHINSDNTALDYLTFSGRLIGGCLDCLLTLCGTKFDKVKEFNNKYKNDGIIWFLESCDLNTFSMRRGMWQLDNAGWFDNVKGFIIGRPMHFNEPLFGLDQYNAILPIAKKHHVPIIFDADFGHLPPAMPIINGSLANVAFNNKKINLEFTLG